MVESVLPPPHDNTNIWRYMNFTKFVGLLSTKSLYFARADTFADKFEGAKGAAALEGRYDEFYLNFLREACGTLPTDKPEQISSERVEEEAKKLLKSLKYLGEIARKTTFINCWHEAEHESEAMWRLYSGWQGNGTANSDSIVVAAKYGALVQCLKNFKNIHVERVKYIDYNKQLVGVNEEFWYKSNSFKHECEIRAILQHRTSQENFFGFPLIIDIEKLIIEVRISPLAPVWFENLVRDVVSRYGYSFPVERSSLDMVPFY